MTFLEALILGVLETEDTETHKGFSVKECPSRRQRVNSSTAWAGHGETLAAAVATENSWNRHFFGNNHFLVGNKTRKTSRESELWWGELKPEVGGRNDA